MSLPTDDKSRKALPIFDGLLGYFPDACVAVAEVSRIGNDQHNPGQPLHWARGKSMDQFNTALRHMMDHRCHDTRYDTDGARHLAKAAWRILAALQLDIEAERAELTKSNEAETSVMVPNQTSLAPLPCTCNLGTQRMYLSSTSNATLCVICGGAPVTKGIL